MGKNSPREKSRSQPMTPRLQRLQAFGVRQAQRLVKPFASRREIEVAPVREVKGDAIQRLGAAFRRKLILKGRARTVDVCVAANGDRVVTLGSGETILLSKTRYQALLWRPKRKKKARKMSSSRTSGGVRIISTPMGGAPGWRR